FCPGPFRCSNCDRHSARNRAISCSTDWAVPEAAVSEPTAISAADNINPCPRCMRALSPPCATHAIPPPSSPHNALAIMRGEINVEGFAHGRGRRYSPVLDRKGQPLKRSAVLVGLVDYVIDANSFLDRLIAGDCPDLCASDSDGFIAHDDPAVLWWRHGGY